ncbi:MAG: T9SS type A sorting domain-containing protein [Bacteroidetes bacterium]|nr:T9SS type A sorting domain-containing protein [Bacteroidota bacterium]
MKKPYNFPLILSLFFITNIISAQVGPAPSIKWQKVIGGSQNEGARFITGYNNGYIVGNHSTSGISGDKTMANFGERDFWVLQIDKAGNIIRQNAYGGTSDDWFSQVIGANDGGSLICGQSGSCNTGNKQGDCFGGSDMWLIKAGPDGNIQWQKTYGGSNGDGPNFMHEFDDGSILIGGYSASEVSGNKTAPKKGESDYWLLKLDATGNIIWQQTYGGSRSHSLTGFAFDAQQNIYLIGDSNSDKGGDKSEDNNGMYDFWLIKTDSQGNILADKTIGGTGIDNGNKIILHHNYIYIGGYSNSGISGDKTSAHFGENDFWLVKLDLNLNIIWDKSFGGSGNDNLSDMKIIGDEIILAGYSNSGNDGNKTTASFGEYDIWMISADVSTGAKNWEFAAGGSQNDDCSSIFIDDNIIMIAGGSNSGVSGNKTFPSKGGYDMWILELDNPTSLPKVEIRHNFKMFPNPASTMVNIEFPENSIGSELAILSLDGKTLKREKINSTNHIMQLENLKAGIYLLETKGEGFILHKKLVIN